MKRPHRSHERRGAVAVEAAICLTLLVILMLGLWEVGRLVQVNQILNNAAREGARLAAGGYVNSVGVTNAQVQQAVKDYMTSAGLPSAAVTGSTVTLTCLSSPTWSNPSAALPLDQFRVTVTVPSGTAFNSLKWNLLGSMTSLTSMTVSVRWQSLNNAVITVPTNLPY
jgi:Flp pilus assembly protein TadG